MPIHVDIRINDNLINTIHIGRASGGGTKPDDINSYYVVEGKRPEYIENWFEGAQFQHRYGDGAEICVKKAIEALYETNIS